MTQLCICTICTCGRHKCPHFPRGVVNKDKPCTLSEYANKYRKYPMEPTKSFKPDAKPLENTAPLQEETTHRKDYIEHPLGERYRHQGEVYQAPQGDFQAMTNYNKDFTKKHVDPVKPAKKEPGEKVLGKFQGEPTYKRDYRKWSAQGREMIVRDDGYVPPDARFEGLPTYTKDYIEHPMALRASMKPDESAKISDAPFDAKTGYKIEFIKHPMEARQQKEKPQWAPNPAKLEGLSNYRKDYVVKDGGKMPSCKPDPNPYQSNAAFADETTHKVDYVKKEGERPYVHKQLEYVKPEGDMTMNTTHQKDYTRKEIEKRPAMRPAANKSQPGEFRDSTNYKEDFRKWPFGERPQQTMRSEYEPPEAPFEGTPTYRRDYVGHSARIRPSMKPDESAKISDAPFDAKTGYRVEFIKHPMEARQQKEKPQWAPNPAKLEGLSNYRKDYVVKDGGKMPSCKPDPNPYQSNAAFADETTHKVDYVKKEGERPYVHKQLEYVKPEGDMNMNTTHQKDYTRKPIGRITLQKPSTAKRTPGKFYDKTNYRQDFRQFSGVDRVQVPARADYIPNEAPFEGMPTYTHDYIKYPTTLTHSMKPDGAAYQSDAPFVGNTEYKHSYIKKSVPPCPVTVIEKGGKINLEFVNQDEVGHKWYKATDRPMSSGFKPSTPIQTKTMVESVA